MFQQAWVKGLLESKIEVLQKACRSASRNPDRSISTSLSQSASRIPNRSASTSLSQRALRIQNRSASKSLSKCFKKSKSNYFNKPKSKCFKNPKSKCFNTPVIVLQESYFEVPQQACKCASRIPNQGASTSSPMCFKNPKFRSFKKPKSASKLNSRAWPSRLSRGEDNRRRLTLSLSQQYLHSGIQGHISHSVHPSGIFLLSGLA